MKLNKTIIITAVLVAAAGTAGVFLWKSAKSRQSVDDEKDYVVTNGIVRVTVKTTANVEPQNRLEVKPTTSGRIEEILVKEGDKVKSGQVVAWISSTERAALLDAAMANGEEKLNYWKEVYKPTPLRAPIDGDVIVRDFEPGQTITTASGVIVLSDRLIVKALVDETDVGKVKVGQNAEITLDAYPLIKYKGRVDHISYESKMVNNVTIYEVDVLPEQVPDVFRSGMSATVSIVCDVREEVPMVLSDAVASDKDGAYVMVRTEPENALGRRKVVVASAGEKVDEVMEGLKAGDVVVVKKKKYKLPSKEKAVNPLMPFGGGKKDRK